MYRIPFLLPKIVDRLHGIRKKRVADQYALFFHDGEAAVPHHLIKFCIAWVFVSLKPYPAKVNKRHPLKSVLFQTGIDPDFIAGDCLTETSRIVQFLPESLKALTF